MWAASASQALGLVLGASRQKEAQVETTKSDKGWPWGVHRPLEKVFSGVHKGQSTLGTKVHPPGLMVYGPDRAATCLRAELAFLSGPDKSLQDCYLKPLSMPFPLSPPKVGRNRKAPQQLREKSERERGKKRGER